MNESAKIVKIIRKDGRKVGVFEVDTPYGKLYFNAEVFRTKEVATDKARTFLKGR